MENQFKDQFIALTGPGGSGKSYLVRQHYEHIPKFALLSSTTGISAVNISPDATTINKLLGYFDTESLMISYRKLELHGRLKSLRESGVKYLVIEEASMLAGQQLELIYSALVDVNNSTRLKPGADSKHKLGILLVYDLGQLPCVDGDLIIDAPCFRNFTQIKLTEIKRQSDVDFVNALNLVRKGNALDSVDYFKDVIKFHAQLDPDFVGTTLASTNKEVNQVNTYRLDRLTGKIIEYASIVKGVVDSNWKNIPEKLSLKLGALVMIKVNNIDLGVSNGDLAIVEELYRNSVVVRLLRNSAVVVINPVSRQNKVYDFHKLDFKVIGTITYLPLVLAFALTTHSSQSLSINSLQVDFRNQHCARTPGLLYTALSRATNPGGLRLVGNGSQFVKACKVNPHVLSYL